MSVTIFVNYADTSKDERWWKELVVNLAPDDGNVDSRIKIWDVNKSIIPGKNKKREIEENMNKAHIFLFLLSPDYFANKGCVQVMRQILALKEQGKNITIIPILIRPCIWTGFNLDDWLVLPRNKKPISSWDDPDVALVQVAEEILKVVDEIDKNESTNVNNPAPPPAASNPPQPDAQRASKYNVQGNTVNIGMMGENHGTVTIHQGAPVSGSDPRPAVDEAQRGEGVDVGIIVALKQEFAVLFSEIGPDATTIRDPQTGEIYYRFERASSVLGRPYRCIGTLIGGMGPTQAALHAEKMITRWNPATLVLPGIAGSLSGDALVGDIVVADQVDGYLENAKANPIGGAQGGYTLAFSGEVYRTSNALLKEIRNFEFSAPARFTAWKQSTQVDLEQLVEMPQRAELIKGKLLRYQAELLEGHIASGPVVGAAKEFTQRLKGRDRKYLALEMEAEGLMTAVYNQASTRNTGTLILRAISDYADERKKELDAIGEGALRRYAMLNAVHFLWSLLDAGLLPQGIA